MSAPTALSEAAYVEKEELVDMAQNVFASLINAIDDLGGHQLAENVKQFAQSMEKEMAHEGYPLTGSLDLMKSLWAQLVPEITDWFNAALDGDGIEAILTVLSSGKLSAELLSQIARLSESESVLNVVEKITEKTGEWETVAIDRLVTWSASERINDIALLTIRAQALMQAVFSAEMVTMAETFQRSAGTLTRLAEILAHPQFSRAIEVSMRIMRNPQVLDIVEELEGHMDLVQGMLEQLGRFEKQGGLKMMTQAVDVLTSSEWNAATLQAIPVTVNKSMEFANWAFASKIPELTQNILSSLDVSIAESRRDSTKYGAMRLVGALKDPAVQDGVKVGLAFLRHLPMILNTKESFGEPTVGGIGKEQQRDDTMGAEH